MVNAIKESAHIDGLVQERCNCIVNALELCLCCTNPSHYISSVKSIMVNAIMESPHIDGLVQEKRNSIANSLELRLSCTNPLIP